MKFRFTLLLLIFLIAFQLLNAQTTEDLDHKAPSLQIGLDQLSFTKGTLDAQLILLMIAEKQRELKLKIVQNMFLGKLDGTGGAVYSYADNVLRSVIEEKEQTVRTRSIIENTVNIVFVYAFAEYYYHKLSTRPQSAQKAFAELAKHYGVNSLTGITSLKMLRNTDVVVKTVANSNGSNKSNEDKSTGFFAMLLDITSEVVRADRHLNDLGVFNISYSATYEYLNEYLDLRNNEDTKLRTNADTVFKDMQSMLSSITQLIGLIYYATDNFTFRYNEADASFTVKDKFVAANNAVYPSLDPVISALGKVINAVSGNIPPNDTNYTSDIAKLIQVKLYLEKANSFLADIKGDIGSSASVVSDMIYTIQADFIPALIKIGARNASIADLVTMLTSQNKLMAGHVMDLLKDIQKFDQQIDPFIKIAGELYRFNKAETFSDYFKLITQLEDIFPDDKIKDVLSKINSFVKDYAVIKTNDKGKEVIDFNVESFLVKLSNMKSYKVQRVQFLFSVGASSGYFARPVYMKGDTLTSFSYLGEKIGLKIKLYDRAFWMTRNPGETYNRGVFGNSFTKLTPPKEPIISDYHLLLYGSGLLYNIINTSTNSEFKAPLVGTGIGVTFINSLDMNLTAAVPIFSNQKITTSIKYPLLSLSFDIRFGEYLERLQQKRDDKRIQNKLAEAKSQ